MVCVCVSEREREKIVCNTPPAADAKNASQQRFGRYADADADTDANGPLLRLRFSDETLRTEVFFRFKDIGNKKTIPGPSSFSLFEANMLVSHLIDLFVVLACH